MRKTVPWVVGVAAGLLFVGFVDLVHTRTQRLRTPPGEGTVTRVGVTPEGWVVYDVETDVRRGFVAVPPGGKAP